jgi:LacI family transcriptional regulator
LVQQFAGKRLQLAVFFHNLRQMAEVLKPKLIDVAAAAGVSTATVSRALSDPQKVRPDTLARVLNVVNRLGYVPDALGRALASSKTQTIGAVMPTLDHAIFARAIQAMQRTFAEAGYQLLVAAHEYNRAAEVVAVRAMLERRVDAIVLVGTDHAPEIWAMLKDIPQPIALAWSFHKKFDSIGFDNERAGRLAAQHLLGLGHQRIAMLSGLLRHNDRARARLTGIRRALAKCGLELPDERVIQLPFSLAAGREGMQQLLALSTRPTAIIGGNDLLAIGAMLEAQAKGLRVPEDLSCVGIDDLELAAHMLPPLTTVQLPTAELGHRCALQVLARLAGQSGERRINLPVQLVVRASSGPSSGTRPALR